MQKITLSSSSAQPSENTATSVLDAPLSALTASSASDDNIKASGSGPRYEAVNSSGMNSKKISSLKASDNNLSTSVWTFVFGTPMEVTSSLVFNIAHTCA
jgi:hypothetical protein